MTLGMVAKELAAACAKKIAKSAIQHPAIQNHIFKKIESRLGITFLEEPATEQNLELLRQVIKEELSPYMDLEELMESFQGTLEVLVRQQQEILEGLNEVKSLLEKISYPTSHHIILENLSLKEKYPTEILERIITGYLIGRNEAITEFNELVDSGMIPLKIKRQLDEFKFLQQLREEERSQIKEFIQKIREFPNASHDLRIYIEIRQLLEITINKEEKMILIGWILDQIARSQSKKDVIALITFSQLLIRIGADEYIPHDVSQEIVTKFRQMLASPKRDTTFTPTEQLEMLHFLHIFDRLHGKEINLLENIIYRQLQEAYGNKKDTKHPQKTKVSNPIARMIRKLKIWRVNPKRSARILQSELKNLKRRKFVRDTPLLRMQLERVVTEANLLSSFLETEWEDEENLPKRVNLDELEYTIKELIAVLNNPNINKLGEDTKLLALEALDACLYLIDILALRNSKIILMNSRVISQALWIQELKQYHKAPKVILKDIIREINATSHQTIEERKINELLPHPPTENEKRKRRKKNARLTTIDEF